MAQPGNFYLGSVGDMASNMGSMFGSNATQGTGMPYTPPRPIASPPERNPQPAPMVTGSGPAGDGPYDPLAAQAVRPTSFGNFDPSYGQNLSTFIGQAYQRPQANQPLQFNPFGNLTDANVNYPNMGGGNAPSPGLPQTLLSWAQLFNPTALTTQQPAAAQQPNITGYDDQGNPIYG